MASKKVTDQAPEKDEVLKRKRKAGYEAWLAKQTDEDPDNDQEGNDDDTDQDPDKSGEARTAGEDASAAAAANAEKARLEEEARIQAIVDERVKQELIKREASSGL